MSKLEVDKDKKSEDLDEVKYDYVENEESNDDDEEMDIIIEVDENEDIISTDPNEEANEVIVNDDKSVKLSDIVLSKHKLEGKHSLKYDSIFKGKKEEPVSEDEMSNSSTFYKDTIEVDKSSNYHYESIDNEEYVRGKLVKEMVYAVLKDNTGINFLNNRRKPSKVDFNNYYQLLKENLLGESFTDIELFNELSVYFSDNLFNMFKLLDNKWRNKIINELQDHIGKDNRSKEVSNRNIYEGTEIEFTWEEDGEFLLITGVVEETDYETSTYRVDSYENIYIISVENITRILNNTKFKYNLNKLNHIDFL